MSSFRMIHIDLTNQSNDVVQHSQNRQIEDRNQNSKKDNREFEVKYDIYTQ